MNRVQQMVFFLGALLLLSSFVHAQAVQVSSVNIDPNPVIPGSYFTIYSNIATTTNASASNVDVFLDLSSSDLLSNFPFSLGDDSPTHTIPSIPAFQTAQVQYRVFVDSKASDGIYHFSISAGERGQSAAKLEFDVKIVNRQPVLSIIAASPQEAEVGKTTQLQLTVKNIGSSPANDITIGVSEDRTVTATGNVVERDLVPLGNAFSNVPSLGVNETTIVNLPVIFNPSSSSKAYFVPVRMTFYDSNKTAHTSTDYIGIKVVAKPQLGLVASGYKPLPVPGQKSQITIDIYNSGLGAAKFLTVKADASWLEAVKNDFYIGTIESDDFDSIVLDGKVSSQLQPGTQSVNVTLTFQNAFGDVSTFTQAVPVKIFSASEVADQSGNSFPLPLVLGAIIVIVGIWYFRFRKPVSGAKK